MMLAAKEFIVDEMKVSEEVFDEMIIEKVFAPESEYWNTLYIQFASESSVHKLYSYTRNMGNTLRLVPYIPCEFYMRSRELESLAFALRHSDIKYKTRIKMGVSDLVLYKRNPVESYWTPVNTSHNTPKHLNENSETVELNLRPNSGTNLNSRNCSQE